MTPLTREWIEKAEGDFATASRELRVRTDPNYDAVCFHAHQCAEKYLKARLQEAVIPFRRTHDLDELLNMILAVEPSLKALRPSLSLLSAFAVDVRYPGKRMDKSLAREAFDCCTLVRRTVRASLSLGAGPG